MASLLDRGPDTVTVYPAGPVKPDGTRGPEGAPVTLKCRVQPSTSQEAAELGYLDNTLYRVLARSLPAGPWSRLTWAGRDWLVVGEPKRHNGSARTRHDTALIRRR
ncbi:hypothetical protein F4556_005186 [Kitasatospora gansuensis]|uniref:Head-tail adaptor protein n=1 Tax=Kitasatospora gansuensis TaxID=258050 RepID=A0A7W7WJU0_9ACTN|nr:hypothetical protein [Kitasatospora gansuensis]MBB4949651.1 hypothetical protein [Kitasatospora gansuensis]